MKLDLSFITNEWFRAALCEALVAKSEALAKWSNQKELELQSDIAKILEDGTHPSEVNEQRLERLCERYDRQVESTKEFRDAAVRLAKDLGVKAQPKPTGDAYKRAKALLAK